MMHALSRSIYILNITTYPITSPPSPSLPITYMASKAKRSFFLPHKMFLSNFRSEAAETLLQQYPLVQSSRRHNTMRGIRNQPKTSSFPFPPSLLLFFLANKLTEQIRSQACKKALILNLKIHSLSLPHTFSLSLCYSYDLPITNIEQTTPQWVKPPLIQLLDLLLTYTHQNMFYWSQPIKLLFQINH